MNIQDILGSKAQKLHMDWQNTKISDILSHQSGAEPNIKYERFYSREDAVLTTLQLAPKYKNGQLLYSNFGYVIIGYLLEVWSGKTWESIMSEWLFRPMNLLSAGFSAPLGHAPLGHQSRWIFTPKSIKNDGSIISDNPDIMRPAGGLHMNIPDLARYGQAMLKRHVDGSELFNPHIPLGSGLEYGYGWVVDEMTNHLTKYWHNGSNTFWHALLIIAPKHELVFAYASNDPRKIGAREGKLQELFNELLY